VRGMVAAVAPRARLVVRPEQGEYSRKFGVHLGNTDQWMIEGEQHECAVQCISP
jgi:hypothetical protein